LTDCGVRKSRQQFERKELTFDEDGDDDEIVSKKEFKPRPLENTGFANLGQWEKHTKVKLKNYLLDDKFKTT
jgi:hypothetical protein